jgi:hypothetical protein
MDYWQKANTEIIQAYRARQVSNEGKARVCARRAAGYAIKGYFFTKGFPTSTPNAFALLNDDQVRERLPQELHLILDHLVLRVDADHNLPPQVDLFQETSRFVEVLHKLSSEEDQNGK